MRHDLVIRGGIVVDGTGFGIENGPMIGSPRSRVAGGTGRLRVVCEAIKNEDVMPTTGLA